ncbi:MAG TPA: hypothetical protein VJZ71_15540 [Phycisphaerae bacterium]|nr:hypothetical protein [Phycisphaerae bacterium]
MTPDPIPLEVRSFISEHMRSISGIRLLLLLHVDPQREWTAQELAHELRAASEWAERELRLLLAQGLVANSDSQPARFRYAPRTEALSNLVSQLAAIYPERRHSIIQILFSVPTDSIQSFADAFRLRKENQDG